MKIYDCEASKMKSTVQSYYNYLPAPEKGFENRCMPINLIRNCPKHNRLVMQFNYPGLSRTKEILVIPYIGDNTISMHNHNKDNNLITWLASDTDQQTRIFQFSPDRRMMLTEFNLVGIMKK